MDHFASFGEGKCLVWADILRAGEDLIIFIGGGEKPHIGSISISEGVPFSLSLSGHKDYIVSHNAARKIREKIGKRCLIIAGIHVDMASKEEIDLLVANSNRCIELVVSKLARN